jgi:hypothetical protein
MRYANQFRIQTVGLNLKQKREKEFKIKQKGKKRNESGAYWARFYPISAQHGAVRAAQPSRRNHGADRWALWVGHTRW